ncbi:MAG: Single-stranded DNA-binding protein [Candidatus Magasanikbacteria bacterium GW2011_GWC2_34_16]|uniref:Single-stranded DNA-binding protein n=2 Tax=Candidatus Magasanikiibacteriota TaxID=1752731 RepID=A0A0G0HDB0_9BACT|nr:MAG: Single-stranded DNA-binding protein [Candidatus Magasanikbacteria bacterium GW2011_GWC2_34_16]KKQ41143.1 MAG: Single-stranded DNA-binding protein [Candidatus Magasanikbacteria bacterium GW2011_GWA2_37_8]
MYDLNRVTIIGRLTRDPEVKTTTTGKSVATVSVATSRAWTDQAGVKQKESEFHNVVFWGKLSEIVGQYLHKASKVYVEGRLRTRDWTDQAGVKHYRTEIVAENLIMLDSAPSGAGSNMPTNSTPVYHDNAPAEVVEEEIKVEDIPF